MSMIVRQDFVVRCTPEQTFDFLSDLSNEPKWNPDQCLLAEKTSDGPIGVGTTYRAQWRSAPVVEVVYTEFDRPRSWRAGSAGSMETRFFCQVEPHPEGARVRSELELVPHGFFKLVFPIFKLFFSEDTEVATKIRRALREHYGVSKAS